MTAQPENGQPVGSQTTVGSQAPVGPPAISTPGASRPRTKTLPTDATLIAAARRGDVDAFDSLADRHRDAALRLAHRTASGSADDLVRATLAAVRTDLGAGAGPASAFRPYLLTALRRQDLQRARRFRRPCATNDLMVNQRTGAFSHLPASLISTTASAFRALPEPAQVALWHTEVDGEPVLHTTRLLGQSASAVAELAFSARAAIRSAHLQALRTAATDAQCHWCLDRLTGYARGTLPESDLGRAEDHLEHCTGCTAAAPLLAAVELDLPLLLATVILGPAAEPYLGRDSHGAAHARRGRLAVLISDAARPVAVAASAIALITAGLVGTLAFTDGPAEDNLATSQSFTYIPVAPTEADGPAKGPASGSGSTGQSAAPATAGPSTPAPVRPAPITRPSVQPAPDAQPQAPRAAAPAAATETAEPAEGRELDLGLATLRIVPGAGPLGLPRIGLG